jgi:hypothetical protein
LSRALAKSRNTAPVSLFPSMFLKTLSTRRVSYSAVLCLGQNPNCSSRSNPRPLTSWRILESWIFSNSLPDLWIGMTRAAKDLSGLQDREHASAFQSRREVLRTEIPVK